MKYALVAVDLTVRVPVTDEEYAAIDALLADDFDAAIDAESEVLRRASELLSTADPDRLEVIGWQED